MRRQALVGPIRNPSTVPSTFVSRTEGGPNGQMDLHTKLFEQFIIILVEAQPEVARRSPY